MIQILTIETDNSTDAIIRWLNYYKINWQRINPSNRIDLFKHINETRVIWFRKWDFNYLYNNFKNDLIEYQNFLKSLDNEFNHSLYSFWHFLTSANKVNSPFTSDLNKIEVLKIAEKYGIKVPKYIFTSSKNEMMNFLCENPKSITKNLGDSISLKSKNEFAILKNLTSDISGEKLNFLPEFIFPSLIQEKIEVDFEVRSIYINKNIYSVAILKNDKNVDIRLSMYNNNIKFLPIKLPSDLEAKIVNTMSELQLQLAAIDLIYSKKGEFYFLEINPSGQFMNISNACNLNLDKKIAEYLIELNHG